MSLKKFNIGVLTFPISKSGITPLSNLINILYPLSNELHLITGNAGYDLFKKDKRNKKERIKVYGITHKKGTNPLTRIVRYLITQLRITFKVITISKKVDIWIFFIGGSTLVFPMIAAKLFKKRVILLFSGSPIHTLKAINDKMYIPLSLLFRLNCNFSDKIILYSRENMRQWGLEKYKNKLLIGPIHFLDFNVFKTKTSINRRPKIIGFIGRLREEKGIWNLIIAIPYILKYQNDIKFLIVGDGKLYSEITSFLERNNLTNKVRIIGWVPRDKIPEYLNMLKLLVLPTHAEGLPNIMLEAMACGTPFLATPVGGILDVIKDEKTGFILKNNNPTSIAKTVIEVLINPPILCKIARNGQKFVEKRFNREVITERYRKILEECLNDP